MFAILVGGYMDNVGAIDGVDPGDPIGPVHDDKGRLNVATELMWSHVALVGILQLSPTQVGE